MNTKPDSELFKLVAQMAWQDGFRWGMISSVVLVGAIGLVIVLLL